MTEPEKEQLQDRIEKAASELAEHFDSVRILATSVDQEGPAELRNSISFDTGRGSFHAQLGQVHEWLTIQDQYTRNWATRNEVRESNPDA